MEKKIETYLPFYLGCECLTEENKKGIFSGYDAVDEMAMITVRYSSEVDDWDVFNDAVGEIDRITLLLRPLSDAKMNDMHIVCDELNVITSNVVVWFDGVIKNGCPSFKSNVKLLNTLRRLHFDCDGLIDAGLAIDKTKAA